VQIVVRVTRMRFSC